MIKWNTQFAIGDYAYFCPFDPAKDDNKRDFHTKKYDIGRIDAIFRSPENPKVCAAYILLISAHISLTVSIE